MHSPATLPLGSVTSLHALEAVHTSQPRPAQPALQSHALLVVLRATLTLRVASQAADTSVAWPAARGASEPTSPQSTMEETTGARILLWGKGLQTTNQVQGRGCETLSDYVQSVGVPRYSREAIRPGKALETTLEGTAILFHVAS